MGSIMTIDKSQCLVKTYKYVAVQLKTQNTHIYAMQFPITQKYLYGMLFEVRNK